MSITREELTRMAEACDLGPTVGPLSTLLDHEWESLHRFALMAYQKGCADASAAPGWLYTRALEDERDATGALARHLGRAVEAHEKTIAALEAERDRLLDEFEARADGVRVRKDRWEWAVRRIVRLLWGNSRQFECDEVFEAVRSVVAERDRLLADLRLIAATDPVDAMLDPDRAVRIAKAAIAATETKEPK